MIAKYGGGTTEGGMVRIEHAGNFCPDPGIRFEWRRAGIMSAPQPVFLYTVGDYFIDYLGGYGIRGRFPFRTMVDGGWKLSASSDVWVGSEKEATRSMFGVWCCVARESYAGRIIDQALTGHEALRLHTLGAAEAMGAAAGIGSIAPGKLADRAVVERPAHLRGRRPAWPPCRHDDPRWRAHLRARLRPQQVTLGLPLVMRRLRTAHGTAVSNPVARA